MAHGSGRGWGSSRCGRPLADAIPSWPAEQRRSWRSFWFPLPRDQPPVWDEPAFGRGCPVVLLRFCSAERRKKTLEPRQLCPAPGFSSQQSPGPCSGREVGYAGNTPPDVGFVAQRFSSEGFFPSFRTLRGNSLEKDLFVPTWGKKNKKIRDGEIFPYPKNPR